MIIKNFSVNFNLDKKVVVVTGAGLIGSTVIIGVAEAGAKVIFVDIDEKKGKKIEKECQNRKLDVKYKNFDITNPKSIDYLIEECLNDNKKIDGWVNIAYPRSENWGKKNLPLYEFWKKDLDMHLGGYYNSTIKVAKIMKKQESGSIINFSSIYGVKQPDFSIYENTNLKNPVSYAIIKGGIQKLTQYIAKYYGKYNIRANVIAPGGVFDNQPDQFVINYEKKTPLKRMATPQDIVGAVIFFLSDASKYITGQILLIDGGWSL